MFYKNNKSVRTVDKDSRKIMVNSSLTDIVQKIEETGRIRDG